MTGLPQIGDVLGGRYRVVGTLGRGGAAQIYDGIDVSIGRAVAIKALLGAHQHVAGARERLLREGYLQAFLAHPHVCGVSDVGTLADGAPFLVMERLAGATVAQRLASEGPLPVAIAVVLACQVLSALSVAHAHGIVHRDVKPANVLAQTVSGLPPAAKLLDFGTATCPSSLLPAGPAGGAIDTRLTALGLVVGTPHYMAPEQASGCRDLDARIDLYQVGVFLYEALSAKRPCRGATPSELLTRIAVGDVVPLRSVLPALAPDLERVIARAMATSRSDRFSTALDFLAALLETEAASRGADVSAADAPTAVPLEAPSTTTEVTQPIRPGDKIR